MDGQERVHRFQQVLDTLTFENFYNLSGELEHLLTHNKTTDQKIVVDVAGLILTKAIDSPSLSFLYARLVQFIFQHCQQPLDSGDVFLKEFLEAWKNEFVRIVLDGRNKAEDAEVVLVNNKPRPEETRWKLRMKILGIAKLIGESFKLKLFQLNVIKDCIDSSLGSKTEEGYEFIYDLLMNCGEKLERDFLGRSVDQKDHFGMQDLFETLNQLSFDTCGVSLRARVALSDLVEHRDMYWNTKGAGTTRPTVRQSQNQYVQRDNPFGRTESNYITMMRPASNCIFDALCVNKPREKLIRRYHREELLRIGRKMKGRKLRINLPISDILKTPKCNGYSSKLSTESISPRPIENYCCNKRSRDGRNKGNGSLGGLNKIADKTGEKAKSDRVSMWLLLARTKRIPENVPSCTPFFNSACL